MSDNMCVCVVVCARVCFTSVWTVTGGATSKIGRAGAGMIEQEARTRAHFQTVRYLTQAGASAKCGSTQQHTQIHSVVTIAMPAVGLFSTTLHMASQQGDPPCAIKARGRAWLYARGLTPMSVRALFGSALHSSSSRATSTCPPKDAA